MHCPSCGAETTLDQRYCRGCGMQLEAVSKLVVAHSSPEALKLEKMLARKSVQQQVYRSAKWGLSLFILGMAVLFTTKTLGFAKPFNLVGGALMFLAMGLMCYSLLVPLRHAGSRSKKLPAPGAPDELPKTASTKELPAAREPFPVPVASVTERTTQLIAVEKMGTPRE
jgi:hypothetical protein